MRGPPGARGPATPTGSRERDHRRPRRLLPARGPGGRTEAVEFVLAEDQSVLLTCTSDRTLRVTPQLAAVTRLVCTGERSGTTRRPHSCRRCRTRERGLGGRHPGGQGRRRRGAPPSSGVRKGTSWWSPETRWRSASTRALKAHTPRLPPAPTALRVRPHRHRPLHTRHTVTAPTRAAPPSPAPPSAPPSLHDRGDPLHLLLQVPQPRPRTAASAVPRSPRSGGPSGAGAETPATTPSTSSTGKFPACPPREPAPTPPPGTAARGATRRWRTRRSREQAHPRTGASGKSVSPATTQAGRPPPSSPPRSSPRRPGRRTARPPSASAPRATGRSARGSPARTRTGTARSGPPGPRGPAAGCSRGSCTSPSGHGSGRRRGRPWWPARCRTCRQRGHIAWNPGITRSPAHGPVRATTSSESSSIVSSAPVSASPTAATTASTWSGVIRASLGKGFGPVGTAERAPVHSGRSAAGSRWTVPRGPNVLTRVRSVHSAVRTSVRVSPSPRSPTDSSAADSTWACARASRPPPHRGRRRATRWRRHPGGDAGGPAAGRSPRPRPRSRARMRSRGSCRHAPNLEPTEVNLCPLPCPGGVKAVVPGDPSIRRSITARARAPARARGRAEPARNGVRHIRRVIVERRGTRRHLRRVMVETRAGPYHGPARFSWAGTGAPCGRAPPLRAARERPRTAPVSPPRGPG